MQKRKTDLRSPMFSVPGMGHEPSFRTSLSRLLERAPHNNGSGARPAQKSSEPTNNQILDALCVALASGDPVVETEVRRLLSRPNVAKEDIDRTVDTLRTTTPSSRSREDSRTREYVSLLSATLITKTRETNPDTGKSLVDLLFHPKETTSLSPQEVREVRELLTILPQLRDLLNQLQPSQTAANQPAISLPPIAAPVHTPEMSAADTLVAPPQVPAAVFSTIVGQPASQPAPVSAPLLPARALPPRIPVPATSIESEEDKALKAVSAAFNKLVDRINENHKDSVSAIKTDLGLTIIEKDVAGKDVDVTINKVLTRYLSDSEGYDSKQPQQKLAILKIVLGYSSDPVKTDELLDNLYTSAVFLALESGKPESVKAAIAKTMESVESIDDKERTNLIVALEARKKVLGLFSFSDEKDRINDALRVLKEKRGG